MLSREEIQKEIEEMATWFPVYEIEKRLNMPPTTLQKVLKGTRELPKKWHNILEAYFISGNKKEIKNTTEEKTETNRTATPQFKNEIEKRFWEEHEKLNQKNQ